MDLFHPEAAQNINNKAIDLLSKVRQFPAPKAKTPAFPSNKIPTAVLTDADVLGEPILGLSDPYGRTVAKFWCAEGKLVGFGEKELSAVVDVVESLQRISKVRAILSQNFLEEKVFLWCQARVQDGLILTFADFLVEQALKVVARRTVWIPISSLEVEHEFPIGRVHVRPITAQMLDGLEESSLKSLKYRRELFGNVRRRMQGHAAIVVEVEAEPIRTFEVAVDRAEAAIGLLRLFSPAAFDVGLLCLCAPLGTEHFPVARAILIKDGEMDSERSIATVKSVHHWRLDAQLIDQFRKIGLDETAALLELKEPSPFQKAVLESHLRYSRSTMLDNLGDKLVYVLTSMESLYLKDGSEQIGQNLAERLAFATAKGKDRIDVVRNVKAIYKMRSEYLHHGVTIGEKNQLNAFLSTAYSALETSRKNSSRFRTASEFCAALDSYKLSGEGSVSA